MISDKITYLLQLADNALIIGHRLSELCGHAPAVETDMALTNLSLDHFGQARLLFQYIAELDGGQKTEDDWAFLRNERQFHNVLLAEQPNTDFAYTIVRQFLFDVFNHLLYDELQHSRDAHLAAIAAKSFKEIAYHLRFSREWTLRLGDGTAESHNRMQTALDELWPFSGELFMPSAADLALQSEGIAPDLSMLAPLWRAKVAAVLDEATLTMPPDKTWMQSGGKKGTHSEHLGHILADMQYMQRAYPNMKW